MPEGPEVKSLTDYLSKILVNKTLNKIEILNGRYLKKAPKNYNLFIKLLPLKIISINCYGKFMWWCFENTEITLWNTLGMTGWWQKENDKHNNIKIQYNNKNIYFNDFRNFGTIIFNTQTELNKKLKTFGYNIFENNEIILNGFINKVKKQKKYIGEILLNQKICAGCGNYLRAETLYIAQINPYNKPNNLTDERIKEIWNILYNLAWYYYNGTIGMKKYKMAYKYNRNFLIYGQKKDPYDNNVLTNDMNGRTIHYVIEKQILYNK